jgi:TonB family protein
LLFGNLPPERLWHVRDSENHREPPCSCRITRTDRADASGDPKPDSGTKGFRITGEVLIALIVNSGGLPVSVHVVRSVDREIDASAVEAFQQWRFDPARKDGEPAAVRVTVEILFHDL